MTAKMVRSQLGGINLDVCTIFNSVTVTHKFPLGTHIPIACARIASLITYPKDAQIRKARKTYANVRIRIACIRIACARIHLEYAHTRRVNAHVMHANARMVSMQRFATRKMETVTMQFFILYFFDSPFSL